MSNDRVVQACVDLSDKSHTAAELLFGFNPTSNAQGIYRHKTVENCLKEVQEQCNDRSIKTEQSWRDGRELLPGEPKLGSIRLDARDIVNNVVYDYKFGQAILERPQVENIRRHVSDDPMTLVVKEVLTTERGGITIKAVGSTIKGSK